MSSVHHLPTALSTLADHRVLITGAAGFLGTHLLTLCRSHAAEVTAVRRSAAAPHAGGTAVDDAGVTWRHADLSDPAQAAALVSEARADIVFHLAGCPDAGRTADKVAPTFRDNLVSTVNVLQAVTAVGCRRVVIVGSLEEPRGLTASSPYAASKAAASGYAAMFHALYATPVVVARTFMVYGPGQADTRKLVPYVATTLLAGGTPRLTSGHREVDWVYVGDVAAGLAAAGVAAGIDGETVDLGTGVLTSVRGVAERIAAVVGRPGRVEFGAVPDRPMEQVRTADVAATTARTGWEPAVRLDDGLRRTVEWYRSRPPAVAPAGN